MRTGLIVLALSTVGLVGCADPCDELQDLCDQCLDPNQRASCERSVDEDPAEICEQNIDSFRNACQ
jgi:hypothetical protein